MNEFVTVVCRSCPARIGILVGQSAFHHGARMLPEAAPLPGEPDPADVRERERVRKLRKRRAYARVGVA